MRIAISGTHVTGKSTLAQALADRLPQHALVPEPYAILAERGYDVAHPPSIDDYVVQLRQSLISLRRRSPNVIFDRCPLDFVGYIAASPGADRFDLEAWRAPIARAMSSLDLLIFLPADAAHDLARAGDDASFRLAVDDVLRDIAAADSLDLCEGVQIVTPDGPWDRRIETVLAHAGVLAASTPHASRDSA